MKREAISHTKTAKLCRLLGIEKWGAVGILESLWHLTARQAPQGNIGKLEDIDIADGIGWKGDVANLIDALVECRWMDRNTLYRLVVHDWPEHADRSVRNTLARSGRKFWDGSESGGRKEVTRSIRLQIVSGKRCLYCGSPDRITVDHIIPISRGGTNNIDNLQPLCKPCNSRKGAKG